MSTVTYLPVCAKNPAKPGKGLIRDLLGEYCGLGIRPPLPQRLRVEEEKNATFSLVTRRSASV